ncbi:hypothetical protein PR048_000523 [Dryococelus australis]|uniref:Uncharacterized protein n=1 Tax=Dryococelus australis TaxID=614101 RepID=A0ABQ9IEW0_9NEOP|nr:hypothetical protein PR048_000523 [Dryococelus australis]
MPMPCPGFEPKASRTPVWWRTNRLRYEKSTPLTVICRDTVLTCERTISQKTFQYVGHRFLWSKYQAVGVISERLEFQLARARTMPGIYCNSRHIHQWEVLFSTPSIDNMNDARRPLHQQASIMSTTAPGMHHVYYRLFPTTMLLKEFIISFAVYPFLAEHLQTDKDIISYLPCDDCPYGMPAFANDGSLQHMWRDCMSCRLEQLLEARIIPDIAMDSFTVDELSEGRGWRGSANFLPSPGSSQTRLHNYAASRCREMENVERAGVVEQAWEGESGRTVAYASGRGRSHKGDGNHQQQVPPRNFPNSLRSCNRRVLGKDSIGSVVRQKIFLDFNLGAFPNMECLEISRRAFKRAHFTVNSLYYEISASVSVLRDDGNITVESPVSRCKSEIDCRVWGNVATFSRFSCVRVSCVPLLLRHHLFTSIAAIGVVLLRRQNLPFTRHVAVDVLNIEGNVADVAVDVLNIEGNVADVAVDVLNIEGNVADVAVDVLNVEGNVADVAVDVLNIEGNVADVAVDILNIEGNVADVAVDVLNVQGNVADVAVYVLNLEGATVLRWSDYSSPTKANRARFPAGSLQDVREWESCLTMPVVGGFSRGSPVYPDRDEKGGSGADQYCGMLRATYGSALQCEFSAPLCFPLHCRVAELLVCHLSPREPWNRCWLRLKLNSFSQHRSSRVRHIDSRFVAVDFPEEVEEHPVEQDCGDKYTHNSQKPDAIYTCYAKPAASVLNQELSGTKCRKRKLD